MADPAVVAELLLQHADALSIVTGLPVAMPDVAFKPPADGIYLRVDLFTNAPFWEGLASGRIDQGLMQVTVVTPKNKGLLFGRRVAAQIMAHFPKTLRITGGGVRVSVNREPWVASPITEDDKTQTPVTIPWNAV